MKSLKPGWLPFGRFCRINHIPQNGSHTRKLHSHMTEGVDYENITPDSNNPTYTVHVVTADCVFGVSTPKELSDEC